MRYHVPLSVRSIAVRVVCALVVAVCAPACTAQRESQSAEFCAIMADGVGLYAGNPVTQMGYKIGTVDSITPGDTSVEVRFTISENRRIPRDVKAVIRSTSVLADRSLELVGNYSSGPQLAPTQCIPRGNTFTPLSISQVIGSATTFVNGISPDGSTNIKDALRGIDAAVMGNGVELNRLMTTSSALLDNPDQTISDIGSIVRNLVQLTTMLKETRGPLKRMLLDTPGVAVDAVKGVGGFSGLTMGVAPLGFVFHDLEGKLGDDIQILLDVVADALRHISPHYKGVANLLNPVPRFINTLSYQINNKQFNLIQWRPPLFRIRTPDGLALCGVMNASMPGSCADVNGQPYAVDVALLQYVLMEAQRR